MNSTLNDLYALFIGTIVALNSIAIPVSYQIISSNLKQLLNRDSHKILLEEDSFKRNLFASFGCLFIFLMPMLFNIFPEKNTGISAITPVMDFVQTWFLILSGLAFIGFLLAFTGFSYRIYEYSSNAEHILFEKSKQTGDKYIQQLNGNR